MGGGEEGKELNSLYTYSSAKVLNIMPETVVENLPETFQQRLERVHLETSVRVPGFIADLPTFTRQQTQAVAEKLNLL